MVFAILLAIASTAAAVVLGIRVRRQSAQLGAAFEKFAALQLENELARTEQDSLMQRLTLTTSERDTITAERDAVAAERDAVAAERDAIVSERDAATTRITDLSAEVEASAADLADVARQRDDLGEQLETLRADPGDAPVLWALEMSRVDRRWQMSVAPGIDMASPLDDQGAADQPRVALDIIADALREETGTPIAIEWTIHDSLSAAHALLVVRIGEELLARSVLRSEQVELNIADADPGVAIKLTATDGDDGPVLVELPDDLLALAVTGDDGVVTITLADGRNL